MLPPMSPALRLTARSLILSALLVVSCQAEEDPAEAPADSTGQVDASAPAPGGDDLGSSRDAGAARDAGMPLDVAGVDAGPAAPDARDAAGPRDVRERHKLDDLLRFNHAQVLGTHNSYHVASPTTVPQWDYTHLPLDEQAAWQGVRQFELDLYWDHGKEDWKVLHVPYVDKETNCYVLGDCLGALKGWSDENPAHYPLVVMIELKESFKADKATLMLMRLEEIVLSTWPLERLLTPDLVRAQHASLKEAIEESGWPTLGELRGRLMVVFHTGGTWQAAYRGESDSSENLLLFPDASGNGSVPYAAFHAVNDPREADRIATLVDAGHVVRTRADADTYEAVANDRRRADAAIASGAHFISTDYPRTEPGEGYGVMIPGGMPAGCNPRTAPPECTPEAVE